MEENPMKTNIIFTALALALCLGFTPQAQGMAYFKAAYNSAYAWGKKATHSALSVKDQAIARMTAIVNHLVPQAPKKSAHSEVAMNRINTIVNHLQPEQKNTAIKRAQVIVGHLAPQETQEGLQPNNCGGLDYGKFNEMDQRLKIYLEQYLEGSVDRFSNPNFEVLANNEMGHEDIFDIDNQKIGTLYFYKLKIGKTFTVVVDRLVNNEGKTVGFCIGETDTDSTKGYIAYLLISPEERRNGYGQILLAYNAKLLYQVGCTKLHGTASSFDLKKGENRDTMQPKLESFYGQFGAQSLDGSSNNLGLSLE